MKPAGGRPPSPSASSKTITGLRARLDEAEETLRAIRGGGVDALVVEGRDGPRVYALEGTERVYRVLVESMNEGALILSADAVILYANQRFATMLHRPLARVIGAPFYRFLSGTDQNALRPLLNRGARARFTMQVRLRALNGRWIPAQVSVRWLAGNGSDSKTFGVVVTDMTGARRSERVLRGLSHSLLRAQESDRRNLAAALHDRTSQSLGALLFRLRLLAGKCPARARALRQELAEISDLVGATADFVEQISRQLRPSVLEVLGLVPALRAAATEFVQRTGIAVDLACEQVPALLSPEAELVLYRVLEEALSNVGKHAKARNATVRLMKQGAVVHLVIRDDGVGLAPGRPRAGRRKNRGMGLLGLRERAAYVGGALTVRSIRGAGTEVEVRIPLPKRAARRPRVW